VPIVSAHFRFLYEYDTIVTDDMKWSQSYFVLLDKAVCGWEDLLKGRFLACVAAAV